MDSDRLYELSKMSLAELGTMKDVDFRNKWYQIKLSDDLVLEFCISISTEFLPIYCDISICKDLRKLVFHILSTESMYLSGSMFHEIEHLTGEENLFDPRLYSSLAIYKRLKRLVNSYPTEKQLDKYVKSIKVTSGGV